MKKNILKLGIIILFVFMLSNLYSQETVSVSGGEALGNGGTASYSIGQMVYTTHNGTNGNSLAQGVQQAYEISVVVGIPEVKDINLLVSVYPNPATYYLTVKVENYETANLQYVVLDINGKLLQKIKATGQETKIETKNLANGIYFVKVMDNKNEIKVFKIVKN